MKKILFAALALTLVSGISYASDGGKKKKKAKTECSKQCSAETSCCAKKSKAA